ncbi:hypothetical protein QP265_25555, partial [Escherichia coli]|nr:hypothetical protein [Escherichia coli]
TRVTPAQQATPAAVPAPAPAPEPKEAAAQPEAPAQIANTDEPEKKKGGAGKTVALVAAALVALGGVGYGAYQLFNSSTEV